MQPALSSLFFSLASSSPSAFDTNLSKNTPGLAASWKAIPHTRQKCSKMTLTSGSPAVILADKETRKRQQVLEHDLPKLLIQRLRPEAVARLRWHAYQGHRLVIVSASPRALIQPVAQHLGAELIATETSDLASEGAIATPQLSSARPTAKEPRR
jgi:phosphoglycolate phosphatase-like HAD superfamily hydrolase